MILYTKRVMNEIKGVAVAPGTAIGQVFVYLEDIVYTPAYKITPKDTDKEMARFHAAAERSINQIQTLRNASALALNEQAQGILDAHMLMLSDPEFFRETQKRLESRLLNVEKIISEYINETAERLGAADSPLLRERAADLHDVLQRLVANLTNRQGQTSLEDMSQPAIIAAHDLLPSSAMRLNRAKVLGIALEAGGKTSHTAILARALGIPAVFGLHNLTAAVKNGDCVILDGDKGKLLWNFDETERQSYQSVIQAQKARAASRRSLLNVASQTKDGIKITLNANAQSLQDVQEAAEQQAQGIGLFRSEFLFLLHSMRRLPDEETQYKAYSQALAAFKDKPVIVRTLDIGGDKILPDSYQENERNPLLGWRAIRFCVEQRDIFKGQLRALYRASAAHNLKIMLPFITSLYDLEQALAIIEEVKSELADQSVEHDPKTPVGIMIETPSAAVLSDTLAKRVDFFSIGTNDLTQYVLAVDRGNEKVASYYQPLHPAVLRLIKLSIDNARQAGIGCSLCGELAGDPLAVPLLIGLGLTSLSMNSAALPAVKEAVLALSQSGARQLAQEALAMPTVKQVVQRLRAYRKELGFDEAK